MTLSIRFPPLMIGRKHEALNAVRIVEKRVVNGLGALNDEGAFSLSNPLVSEELSDARRLCARQQGGR